MDLRSIRGKSLPEPSALCKVSHIRGPMVLQVQLLNIADVCSGIVCLNSEVIIILGGVVQSLHEEWQMKRKYLVDSHHTVKLSRENASSCTPPYEKLQIQAPKQGITRFSGSSSNEKGQRLTGKDGGSNSTQTNKDLKVDRGTYVNLLHDVDKKEEEKPTCSLARPKVTASVPVQNQVAAQKLLQKSTLPNHNSLNSKSQIYKGKGKQEESAFLCMGDEENWK